jgi:hypothetical protein
VRIEVWRSLSPLSVICDDESQVTFFVDAPGADLGHLGLQLRVVSGRVPFPVPTDLIALDELGAVQTWSEEPGRIRGGFQARMAAKLVSSDGRESPWFEFAVDTPDTPPSVYVHPLLKRALSLVVFGHPEKLVTEP